MKSSIKWERTPWYRLMLGHKPWRHWQALAGVGGDFSYWVYADTPSPETQTIGRWLPIELADKDIAVVYDLPELTFGHSYPIWARDEDGRVFECVWNGNAKRPCWFDLEAESPVDPVEFMPHQLDPRFAAASEGRNDG